MYEFYFRADNIHRFKVFKWGKGAKHVDTQSTIFRGQNKLFWTLPEALKASKWPNMYWYWCILPPWYVWVSLWASRCIIWGNWQFLLVRALFWHFWGCLFRCFKMALFGLRRIFAPFLTVNKHTNSLFQAKKVEKHLELVKF